MKTETLTQNEFNQATKPSVHRNRKKYRRTVKHIEKVYPKEQE